MSEPMTEAERAVVDVLEGDSACTWHVGCDVEDCYGPRARAIVAKLRPLIEHEAAGKALLAAVSDIETVIDALTITNGANSTIKGLERAKAIIHNRAEQAAQAHLAALRTTTSEETR
jgi:hypothetical protein